MKDQINTRTPGMHDKAEPKRRRKRTARRTEPVLHLDAGSVSDLQAGKLPESAQVRVHSDVTAVYCVPVAFVARDWGVSARRVRALLAAGRLGGALLPNGYWEVRYPYLYAEGMRGPAPRRHQRLNPSKKPELRAVRNGKPT